MASDPPQLDFNDILLNIEAQLNSQTANGTLNAAVAAPADAARVVSRSLSPEPPDEQELLAMRLRALSIRDSKGKEREDSTGNELIDMVLRLTGAVPARTQIMEQAAVISRLTVQRDIIFKRIEDERERWQAEKDSLQRVCEALILQANASHNGYKDQKTLTLIEADNIILRGKLADVQNKVSSLEAELAQLRPLLLMHPSAIAASKGLMPSSGKAGKKDTDDNAENRNYYRVRDEKEAATSSPKSASKKKKASAYFKHAPAVADARSEHLLLAMRKLGRERATLLSQSMYRTADTPATAPSQEPATHTKTSTNPPRPMMSPAVWPAHLQHAPSPAGQRINQQAKSPQAPQAGASSPGKSQQNPPPSQFGPPPAAHFQPYFVPQGSAPRPPGAPGTPMPPPGFYHAGPPRGYIPGPAWPYYAPGPYTFSQPIPVHSPRGANASSAQPQSSTSPPSAGPSHSPAPPLPQSSHAPLLAQKTNSVNQSAPQNSKSARQSQQPRGPRTPQPKSVPTPMSRGTPMDNLLSAAQSVFTPSAGSVVSGGPPSNDLGSPLPRKRRRVDQQQGKQARGQSKGKQPVVPEPATAVDRPASALDVLADQAAGVFPSASGTDSHSHRRGHSGDVFATGSSNSTGGGTADGNARHSSSIRKGKRPARASSTTPIATTASSSLAAPMPTQRAASEDRAPSVTSQISTESFKLRPVADDAFLVRIGGVAPPGRSSPVPRSVDASSKRGTSVSNRARQTNGRASTPISRRPAKQSRAAPSRRSDAGGEGASIESEDEPGIDGEVDQLGHDSVSVSNGASSQSTKRTSVRIGDTGEPGEDVNSRRWLEILGRKGS